ncbi:MAG: aldo/keto reductase [Spirochaetes bacterium]|nr:aldo/keto reductase [Spirochaetota bacterium]
MNTVRLGRTGLSVSASGFGAIPIQRLSFADAERLLKKAYDSGITFFDTARSYSDSEEKIGRALSGVRKNIVIATKSPLVDAAALRTNIETSLRNLRTGCIDILQLHNPPDVPGTDHEAYRVLLDAKAKGQIRFIGFTNHQLKTAREALLSGLYDTIQFPFNHLSTDDELALIGECANHDVGVIVMKALSGGLITDARRAFAFLRQYKNAVPIWGIEKDRELDEFVALEKDPPVLDAAIQKAIDDDRRELSGSFCRACGYCMPCPQDIQISMAARMSLLLNRMPYQQFMSDTWRERMERIAGCTECGSCKEKCPYGLDTPELLKKNLIYYRDFYQEHRRTV